MVANKSEIEAHVNFMVQKLTLILAWFLGLNVELRNRSWGFLYTQYRSKYELHAHLLCRLQAQHRLCLHSGSFWQCYITQPQHWHPVHQWCCILLWHWCWEQQSGYSDTSTVLFDLDDHSSVSALQQAINSVPYTGGFTNTPAALDDARLLLDPANNRGARPSSQGLCIENELLDKLVWKILTELVRPRR